MEGFIRILYPYCLFVFIFFSPWPERKLRENLVSRRYGCKEKPVCVRPHLRTHDDVRRKWEDNANKHRSSNITSVGRASGHKEAAWPQPFKAVIWGLLMCIDSYCTKGTKTINGCFVCWHSSPKIPWYVQWSNLCLLSERSHCVCEIHANITILCFSQMNLVCFPCVLVRQHLKGSSFIELRIKKAQTVSGTNLSSQQDGSKNKAT